MYETIFPVSDLARRRTQTGLVVACLTLSVASTLFLLLFSSRMGVGFASASEAVFTIGLSLIFAQFITFIGVLIFVVGAVLTSFIVFLMMTQRTRDFGLIKAAGCPNALMFGYYMTELFIVTVLSCTFGIALGLGADYALSSLSSFPVYHNSPNFWYVPLLFVAFFVIAFAFGTKPLLNATRLSPLEALSPVQYYGLSSSTKAKPFTKSNLTVKIALRSLFRRKTGTVRIVLLLSIVFILLTVSVAGSIIAKETTTSWIQEVSGQNVLAVAHESMAQQYESLQSAFTGTVESAEFNYTEGNLAIPNTVVQGLQAVPGIVKVDPRLVLKEHFFEIANFTIDPDTQVTMSVGDKREGDFIAIGVDPSTLTGKWHTQGRFLTSSDKSKVVVGDTLGQELFSVPLAQSTKIRNSQFAVVGICIDPIDKGKVAYIPLKELQNTTEIYMTNIVFVALDPNVNRAQIIGQISDILNSSNLVVFGLDDTLEKNVDFMGSTWSTIMLLPLFTLLSAAMCLVAYIMLAIDEQRQEFGFLRAMGAKPRTITEIVAVQSAVVLLSSIGFGLSLGTIVTLLILMRQPLVTSFMIAEIASWLLATLAGMFILSLIPAWKLARTSLLKMIT